jgi:DNA polymerase-4
MRKCPFTISSYPRAIIHIDGDAFFASCEQAHNPKLKGKPVVTGKERGIAASMSYEAKARGVVRGMSIGDVKAK